MKRSEALDIIRSQGALAHDQLLKALCTVIVTGEDGSDELEDVKPPSPERAAKRKPEQASERKPEQASEQQRKVAPPADTTAQTGVIPSAVIPDRPFTKLPSVEDDKKGKR
jgi:hypothetical protein